MSFAICGPTHTDTFPGAHVDTSVFTSREAGLSVNDFISKTKNQQRQAARSKAESPARIDVSLLRMAQASKAPVARGAACAGCADCAGGGWCSPKRQHMAAQGRTRFRTRFDIQA